MVDRIALSKRLSHALRHDPAEYGLQLDAEGWASLDALLAAPAFAGVGRAEVVDVVENGSKRRFALDGDRIRAVYGHSVEGRIEVARDVPPSVLFHGTRRAAWGSIAVEGLRPQRRQYVHLAADQVTARVVAVRWKEPWVLLRVDAARAAAEGIVFYRADDGLWLADAVPPGYLAEEE